MCSSDLTRAKAYAESESCVKITWKKVKNASGYSIYRRDEGVIVFNGPDEQLLPGLTAGAVGGIGGTYGSMPCLYLKIFNLVKEGKAVEALPIMDGCRSVINLMCSARGNLYAVLKAVIRINEGIDAGSVRPPLMALVPEDMAIVEEAARRIKELETKFL